MNLYEAEDFFKNVYKDKKISFEFDIKCMSQLEIIQTDGLPHELGHIEYRKVKVTVEDKDPMYVPIAPHRGCIEFDEISKYVAECKEYYKQPQV